jgi:rhamnose transport system substrate-binding protein
MKLLKSLLAATAVAAVCIAAPASAAEKRIALVVKALGIGFFEAAAKGAEEAAK